MQNPKTKTPPRTSKKTKNKTKRVLLSILSLFILLIIALPFYAWKVEPFLVHVNHVELGKKNDRTPLNVVQISDLQVSEYYETNRLDKVIEKVNAQKPDILLFTGDLFDNYSKYPEQRAPMIEKLNAFKANIGKYAVWGNHDYGGGAVRVYEDVMSAGGFTVLRNQGETLTLSDGRQIFLGGLDDSLLGNPSVSDTLAYRQNYDYAITMTHEPDVADAFIGTDTQLVLAGHSHGGQVWIPFYPIKNVLAEKYTRGLYQLDAITQLYVNTGIGTTSIHARFGVIPEVTQFTIYI
ncbi:metallophosphoesterase [Lactococcus garvieae subsp. garvieae]|uniref:metallophosphoesterase n=1 Tax=Lactococcus garvieae TaxID=1363 RepID=UPI0005A61F84|nr:metallophosphoesterase [Lactococcus garvieae]KAA8713652.1 metallophosphoesterase [Lactococcus garvieae subsp. garvieae]MDG6190553.1 metallophosphoesterase [Lactococcus garvieae]PCS03824.1 phosphatase [Lactococcus garvieae]QPR48434.1 metallophosphoesterase [Lactococcus garvieae]